MTKHLYLEIPRVAYYENTHDMFLYGGNEDVVDVLLPKTKLIRDEKCREFLDYDNKFILGYNECADSAKGAWELCLTNDKKEFRNDEILLRFENLLSFAELIKQGELEHCEDFTRFEYMRMDNLVYDDSYYTKNDSEEDEQIIEPAYDESDGYCKECNLELHVCPIFGCGDGHSFDDYLERQGFVDSPNEETSDGLPF